MKRPDVKKYAFNTGWVLAENLFNLTVGLFVGVYVARYLGPEQFGLLNYSISFVFIFGALARLGLNNIIVRNVILYPESRDEILGTSLALRIGGGFLLLAAVYVAVQFTNSDRLTRLLVMIIAAGYIIQSFDIIDYYFQSQVQARPVTKAKILALFFSSVIRLTLIGFNAHLIWFAVAVTLEECLKAIFYSTQYLRAGLRLSSWSFNNNQAKFLLRDSWPLILSGLAVFIYMRIDQIMIKEFLDARSVGLYAVSVKLSEVWFFVPLALVQSLYPAILTAKQSSEADYYHRLQQLYDGLIWISIAAALLLSFLGKWVVVLLYGQEYLEAGPVLIVLAWSGIFVSMNLISSKWLLTENMQFFAFVRNGLGAVFNILINLFLIPLWGIHGAAIATLLSLSLSSYFCFALSGKTRINFKIETYAFIYPIRILFHPKKDQGNL